jgi:hypothetical protein
LRVLRVVALALASSAIGLPALADDPGQIGAYVTPYYNSAGPSVHVGLYSAGLATKNQAGLVATIRRMKKQWNDLNFAELYVGAIRLYDFGFRNEATYWFYTAQYRGRQFAALVDATKAGSIGDPGFELLHAQSGFFELVGPNVNGFAFGNVDLLATIVRRVQHENRNVGNLRAMYPGVTFLPASQWPAKNAAIDGGLGDLADQVVSRKSEIARERAQNGTGARFAHLNSTPFPGGY